MFSKVLCNGKFSSKGIKTANKGVGRRDYSINIPLTDFLPHFNIPEGKLSAPSFRSSTLPNGLKIVTVDGNHPVSSVGLFINSGSRFEDASTAGASFFLKHMAFKSTQGLTSLRWIRNIEVMGAQYEVACGREHMAFTSQVTSEQLPQIVKVLLGNFSPKLMHWEVRDEVEKVIQSTNQIESNPRAVAFELLHQEAYRNRGLGQSLSAPHYNLYHLDDSVLKNFVAKNYRFDGSVIAATGGVSHDQLREIVLQNLPQIESIERTPVLSEYFGGDARVSGGFDSHIILGFQGVGLNSKDFFALALLETILGKGSIYGHEAIGTGQSFRLNSRIVTRQSFIHEMSAFNINYSDSGLFGVLAVTERGKVHVLVDLLLRELNTLKKISEEELQRAKASLLSQYADIQDSRLSLLEYVGKNAVLNAPKQDLPNNIAQAIKSVTTQDVVSVAANVFKSKPTLVVLGDVEGAPTIENIRANLK